MAEMRTEIGTEIITDRVAAILGNTETTSPIEVVEAVTIGKGITNPVNRGLAIATTTRVEDIATEITKTGIEIKVSGKGIGIEKAEIHPAEGDIATNTKTKAGHRRDINTANVPKETKKKKKRKANIEITLNYCKINAFIR